MAEATQNSPWVGGPEIQWTTKTQRWLPCTACKTQLEYSTKDCQSFTVVIIIIWICFPWETCYWTINISACSGYYTSQTNQLELPITSWLFPFLSIQLGREIQSSWLNADVLCWTNEVCWKFDDVFSSSLEWTCQAAQWNLILWNIKCIVTWVSGGPDNY